MEKMNSMSHLDSFKYINVESSIHILFKIGEMKLYNKK